MEAVMDFISEYGIWVLVVLVILLITVIGFLVDSKRKKKLREKTLDTGDGTSNVNASSLNDFNSANMNSGAFGMQDGFNSMNSNFSGNMNATDFNNNMMNQNGNVGQNMNNMANQNTQFANNFNQMATNFNNSIDTANLSNNMTNQNLNNNTAQPDLNTYGVGMGNNVSHNNEFFTPVSEQTPKIEPREVVIPKPVEVTPINTVNQVSGAPTPVVEPSALPNVISTPMQGQSMNINQTVAPNVVPSPTVVMPNSNVTPNTMGTEQTINSGLSNIPSQPIGNINSQTPDSSFVGSGYQQNVVSNNDVMNNQQMNTPNVAPSSTNNNFLSGGSNFVFGSTNPTTGPTTNVQPNQGNDNWKL